MSSMTTDAKSDLIRELRADLESLIDLRDNHLSHAAAVVRALVQKRIEASQAALKSYATELDTCRDALSKVQVALAQYRDDQPILGGMTLEEVKYTIVDPVLDACVSAD